MRASIQSTGVEKRETSTTLTVSPFFFEYLSYIFIHGFNVEKRKRCHLSRDDDESRTLQSAHFFSSSVASPYVLVWLLATASPVLSVEKYAGLEIIRNFFFH